ncbi:MAG: sigma-70 family RNA polymerase sigma factor [Pseudomonadota bacterium]
MHAIAQQDRNAFAQLMGRHLDRVHQFAVRSGCDRASADDVAQECFLRVWQRAGSYQSGRGSVRTWLLGITRNLTIDRARREQSRPEGSAVDDPELDQMANGAASASDTLARAQRSEALQAAIAKLPERQRSALILCQLQGHSQADAAAIMQTTSDAIESLLGRARRQLKKALSTKAGTTP